MCLFPCKGQGDLASQMSMAVESFRSMGWLYRRETRIAYYIWLVLHLFPVLDPSSGVLTSCQLHICFPVWPLRNLPPCFHEWITSQDLRKAVLAGWSAEQQKPSRGPSYEGLEGERADSASQFVGQGQVLLTHIHASLWDPWIRHSAVSVGCGI